jgi:hypothetical protein
VSAADDRLKLDRLDGKTISAGCWSCPLLKQCGGYTRRGGGWSCMDRCADCDKSKCTVVCMKKPADFARALLQVGSFNHREIPKLEQQRGAMPRYVLVRSRLGRGDYPQPVAPIDWDFHESFLRAHPEVDQIALEFQTGLARLDRAALVFERLAAIQDRLQRRLHLFAIGASRYRTELPKRFDTFTILDSMPFMKAVKRRAAGPIRRRVAWDRAPDEDVADLVLHNVARYAGS